MSRKIYEISGPDRVHFLQGLVTNDVKRVTDGAVYTALLTPQGKFIADFMLVARGDTILLDIDAAIAEATIKRLSMYKLRADVAITPTDLAVYRGTGDAPDGAVADPRHPDMGWRLYGERDGDDGSDWDAIRVEHIIPETGIELTPDTYILETGFERLHGVDFRKGCYVGQEVTARMKHKTELRKGLARVRLSHPVPVGTDITVQGKTIGTIQSQAANHAIAYLRFDKTGSEMMANDATVTLDS